MADKESVARDAAEMLQLGVNLGMLTAEQVQSVCALQSQMRRSGISLPVGQTLLERKYISLPQLKDLRREFNRRMAAARQAAPTAPAKEPVTKKFGQYEIIKVLSEKDRARVFQARDTMMNRIVVLKVLPRSMTSDPQWAERFRREIILAGKLAHPNIATVYGAGEVDGNPLMTIEYIEGMSLGERLEREGNMPEKVAWRMAREVAKGLAFAASNGVVHRDIKPDNILCSVDGRIKIIDMGLSKSEGDVSGLTLDGTTVGTPFYISPEQARGTRDVDSRSDLYSLGCTVFHMLTGSVPFFHEEFTEVMRRQAQAPRPDPRDVLPEINEASALLVMRMMSINPVDRPDSFESLIEEIDAMLPMLPEPVADVRPVTHVSSSDEEMQDRRAEFWAPPSSAPAPTGNSRKNIAPAMAKREPSKGYSPTPKTSAFDAGDASSPAHPPDSAAPASRSFVGRIAAWFSRLFR